MAVHLCNCMLIILIPCFSYFVEWKKNNFDEIQKVYINKSL